MKLSAAIVTLLALAGAVPAQAPGGSAPPAATATAPATSPAATVPATAPATAALHAPVNPPGREARALIIGGLGGDEAYARNVLDWCNRCYFVLTRQCGLKSQNVILLTDAGDPSTQPAASGPPRRQSTLENVNAALDEMTRALTPQDQFILFIAGLGQINEPTGKLCLPGPDLKADDLADRLAKLPTRKIVIVNTACGGAQFLKSYLTDGRVILTAAGAESDGVQTYFAEFFLRGCETARADDNKDGLVDLLEAYVYAGKETCNFYHRQYLLMEKLQRLKPGEPLPWLVRGKETRQIWRRVYAGTANELSLPKRLEKDQAPLPADLDNEPDPECVFGRFGPEWHHRRVLAERSRLDDITDTEQAYFIWQPYELTPPPAPEKANYPGEETYLARRTVLGGTELLKTVGKSPTTGPSR